MSIYKIIQDLNADTSSNYKISVLEQHQDNALLKRVLAMTYDKVKFTYGLTLKHIQVEELPTSLTLPDALDILEQKFCTREYTGHLAILELSTLLGKLAPEDREIVSLLVNRDLRINVGKTSINKVFKNLIIKPPYMRCSLLDKIDNIEYPAIVQIKADGAYQSLIIDGDTITTMGRSGETRVFPIFNEKIRANKLRDGVYIGELQLKRYALSKDRHKANGLINSDTEQEDMYLECWDYLSLKDWDAKKSYKPYEDRFKTVRGVIHDVIAPIPHSIVNSFQEAMKFYKEAVANGKEGAVLKNLQVGFKDGTSQEIIKLKEEGYAEVIVTGFIDGKKGKRLGSLGSVTYASSCGQVTGAMSGFSDEWVEEIWKNKEKYLGKIFTIKYNGVTKAQNSETYSLSFATFEDFRFDKDEADDLEYIRNALK